MITPLLISYLALLWNTYGRIQLICSSLWNRVMAQRFTCYSLTGQKALGWFTDTSISLAFQTSRYEDNEVVFFLSFFSDIWGVLSVHTKRRLADPSVTVKTEAFLLTLTVFILWLWNPQDSDPTAMATKGPPDFNLIRQNVYTLKRERRGERENNRSLSTGYWRHIKAQPTVTILIINSL